MNTVGANFMKNMIAGTAAGGAVELAAKPIVGKEFTPAIADLMSSKETREKYPNATNMAKRVRAANRVPVITAENATRITPRL